VNKALKRKRPVEEWVELSPEGSREVFYKRLARLKSDSSVLCVGHEPYLTSAIGDMITGGREGTGGIRILLKKGGLARISVSGFGPRVNGELRWLLTPKQIRKMA
jgi:phosphohistidine phosphatase